MYEGIGTVVHDQDVQDHDDHDVQDVQDRGVFEIPSIIVGSGPTAVLCTVDGCDDVVTAYLTRAAAEDDVRQRNAEAMRGHRPGQPQPPLWFCLAVSALGCTYQKKKWLQELGLETKVKKKLGRPRKVVA